jgi:Matrixin
MMNRKSSVTVFILLAVLLVGSASAYVLLSPRRTWDGVVNITVDNRGNATITDSDGGATKVVQAITANVAWNGAGTGTRVSAQKGSVAGFQLGDGIVMLNFQDPVHACNGNCLAATFTGYYEPRGDGTYRITDADIVTNKKNKLTSTGEPDGCSAEYYVEGIMVHEVGHVLGLGHTNVSGATMYPSVSACNNGPATIEADDKAGIQDLY